MPVADQIAPRLSPDILVRPLDESGQHVVKNRRERSYLKLGEQESFLLLQLDGKTTYEGIAQSFEQRFREPLTCEEVHAFVAMAKGQGLLERKRRSSAAKPPDPTSASLSRRIVAFLQECHKQARKQNPLYFRVKLFDPDRVLNWLEPRTRWLFSPQLAVAATLGFLLALFLTWGGRAELASQFANQFTWKTLLVAWWTTILVTICHEFGHGLACKRYGGEVREMGALWIFFTPCLFCNVSDAWLLPSRWQRFLISLAGTYVDLLIWIVAVFVWRVSHPSTTANYMAWIIVSTCGVRVLFNVNPLLRMDGYYALSDLLEIPNLRRRSRQRWMEYVRWLLWGGPRPQAVERGRPMLVYGVISWFFTVSFLNILCLNLANWMQSMMGLAGLFSGITLCVALFPPILQG